MNKRIETPVTGGLTNKALIQPTAPVRPQGSEYLKIAVSPISTALLDTLIYGADLANLQPSKAQISHGTKYEVFAAGNERKIKITSSKYSATLSIKNADIITGSNKAEKKLFVFCLQKVNEQLMQDGKLVGKYTQVGSEDGQKRLFVSFPLQELVDVGMYSSIQSARTGFNSAVANLKTFSFSGELRLKKTKEQEAQRASVEGMSPFKYGTIVNGQCFVHLENDFNWELFGFGYFYSLLPRYFFSLSNRAGDLLYYIFLLARQNTRDIEKNGSFNINFRAIQKHLNLPSEERNRRPKQTIKDPIDRAIEEIELAHFKEYNNDELQLEPVYDDEAPITEYLNNGYLKIFLNGELAAKFSNISKKAAEQIEKAEKRKERIIEQALIKNTAEALKAKDEAESEAEESEEE